MIPSHRHAAHSSGRRRVRRPSTSPAAMIQSLEGRRLLSVTYNDVATIQDPAPEAFSFDGFGSVLATSGNYVAVGRQLTNQVLLFDSAGNLLQTFDNPNTTDASDDQFGAAIAFVGANKLAVSAPDNTAGSTGKVYLYNDFVTDATPDVTIDGPTIPVSELNPGFGYALAGFDGDVLVQQASVAGTDVSQVLRFDGDTGAQVGSAIDTGGSNNQLGNRMAGGTTTFLLAARDAETNTIVYEYDASGTLVRTFDETVANGYGASLAYGPGGAVIIGSINEDAVYQYAAYNPAVTGAPVAVRTYSGPAFSAFGAVAVGGNRLVVGASLQDGTGGVFIYDLTDGSQIASISAPTGDNNGQSFGTTVGAFADGRIVVGDPLGDATVASTTYDNAGAAYIYEPEASNISPTADAGVSYTVAEGGSISLAGSGNDSDGTVASLEWDLNYDGSFDATSGATGTSPAFSAAGLDNGSCTVALRVTDNGGASTIATATVTITNAAPANVAIVAPATTVRQLATTFSGSFSDAGSLDTHEVRWDFGDGAILAYAPATAGTLAPSHTYAATGTYTVSLSIRDDDGSVTTQTHQITVAAAAIIGGDLYIGGTNGADAIDVRNASGSALNVLFGGNVTHTLTPAANGKIVIVGGAGNDDLQVQANVLRDADIYGGAGDDTIIGGGGDDFLYGEADADKIKARGADDIVLGGAGDDLLSGGDGRDILIGGTGADRIAGNEHDDVLISATTSWDNDRSALEAIQAIWLTADTYTNRVATLSGSYLDPDVHVFNDNDRDVLTGGEGQDWFLYNQLSEGVTLDKLTDLQSGEFASDLDFING